jgi:catechol 2,3-dioxygenase-like lactoylglutathione lyase family enzyme
MITDIHHAQITIPPGSEAAARTFYCTVLGLSEASKPPSLAGRGGFWLAVGYRSVHVGVEDGIDRSRTKAHLAYEVSDLAAMRRRLAEANIEVIESIPIPGHDRLELRDPFGNRVELIQPHAQPVREAGRAEVAGSIATELRLVIEQRSLALLALDANALEPLLADDFTYVNSSGELLDKARYLAFVAGGPMRWSSQEVDEMEVREIGDTAIVTCRVREAGSWKGEPFEARIRSTQVYQRCGGRWLYVAGQTNAIEGK